MFEETKNNEGGQKNGTSEPEFNIPSELPILPIKNVVVYPYLIVPLMFTNQRLIKLVDDALVSSKIVGLVTQKNADIEDASPDTIYNIGTASMIIKMLRFPNGSIRLLVQGLSRIKLEAITQVEPYIKARVSKINERTDKTLELEALMRTVTDLFRQIISFSPQPPEELLIAATNIEEAGKLADFIASNINIDVSEKQQILEEFDPYQRLEKLYAFLNKELNILKLGSKIQSKMQTEMDKEQKEYYLREQLRAIRKELGEDESISIEIDELREKIKNAKMPEEAEKASKRELERLSKMPPAAAEYTVSRTYLDWMVNLPWSISTEDNIDIESARKILDEDHYDLEKIKERILEYLSVRKLKKDLKGPILCFVGPPGVGKTSLGRSIARAIGRKFVRVSLGGIRDEAEIRGHRRTYVGALPGRIIQGIRKAESNNPVFMLDEIDKIGTDFRGDPSAALLEVLDPEQNNSFSDHYLDVAFDLSNVMFITTANMLHPIPSALKDRLEVLDITGYTIEEKVNIATRFLIPRQLEKHGITQKNLTFKEPAIRKIISDYTSEAGVRNLEREIANVCRKVARRVAEGNNKPVVVTPDKLKDFLGVIKFYNEIAQRKDEVGVSTGLAWTPVGGRIQFVETTAMKGKKGITITGQLGSVMKESVQIALSYIKSNAKKFEIDPDAFEEYDIHVHVPEGATKKDGPSAGIAITTSLISLFTGYPVNREVAMTGEITLKGKILPIGGVKEKLLGAKLAGIKTVILPKMNEKDMDEVPEDIKSGMNFIFVDNMQQVLDVALIKEKKGEGITGSKKRRRVKRKK